MLALLQAMVVAFSSQARISGKGRRIIPHLRFYLFNYFQVGIISREPTPRLKPGISPQMLSKPRRLWTSVPRRVACELVSLIGLRAITFRKFESATVDTYSEHLSLALIVPQTYPTPTLVVLGWSIPI